MEREGPEDKHDTKSPGRPWLNAEQEHIINGGIDGTPHDSGFERGSWNARMSLTLLYVPLVTYRALVVYTAGVNGTQTKYLLGKSPIRSTTNEKIYGSALSFIRELDGGRDIHDDGCCSCSRDGYH